MNLPNKITLTRIVLIPFFLAAFMLKEVGDYFIYIAAAIFVVASVTDFLDGYIARKYNLVTDMGKFLDPIADKLLVASALFVIIGYTLIPPVYGVIFVSVIIGREFAVSALRQIAATKNVVIAADKLGKAKTAITIVAITVMLVAAQFDALIGNGCTAFYWTGFSLLSVSVAITLISGVNYIVKNRKVFA